MNIEDSDATPTPRPAEPAPGESQGERRSPRPRRRREDGSSAATAQGEASSSAAGSGERRGERRGEGRQEGRGGRGGSGGGERRDRGGRGGERSGGRGRPGDNERGPRSAERREPAPVAPAASEKPVAQGSGGHLEDLGGDLLASVSRSFSLTIRLLPEPLREPISLGYLLARAQDTVADTPKLAAATRLEHLRALLDMVKYGADAEVLRPLQRDLVTRQEHDGERELLQQLDRCLAWLEDQPTGDRWELRRTLARIGRAQETDLLRFGDTKADAPKTLATGAELDEYTYLIAGCVGELWTRLCERHLPAGWSRRPETEMLALGRRFGQGLQMVNILRDLPEDLVNGRCYVPADLLAEHGLEAADLTKEPARARPLIDALRQQAVEHLDAAWEYVLALTPRKLRYAVALPVLIGLETLGLLAKTSPLESGGRLKVSRSSMKGLLASAAVGAAFAPWFSRLHGKLRKRAAANR